AVCLDALRAAHGLQQFGHQLVGQLAGIPHQPGQILHIAAGVGVLEHHGDRPLAHRLGARRTALVINALDVEQLLADLDLGHGWLLEGKRKVMSAGAGRRPQAGRGQAWGARPTCTPAHFSMCWMTQALSLAPSPWVMANARNWRAAGPTCIGTPSFSASSMHSFTSLCSSSVVKRSGKPRSSTPCGMRSCVANERPLETFSTSSIVCGSRPALTP